MSQEHARRIEMDPVFWNLLEKTYCVIKARAEKRGLPAPTNPLILGGILSFFFLSHYESLLSEQMDVSLETTREHLRAYFTDPELALFGAPSISVSERNRPSEDIRASELTSEEE